MWARRYAGVSSPAFFRCATGHAKLFAIPVNYDGGEQVRSGNGEVLAFFGAVADFPLLAEPEDTLSGHDVPHLYRDRFKRGAAYRYRTPIP